MLVGAGHDASLFSFIRSQWIASGFRFYRVTC